MTGTPAPAIGDPAFIDLALQLADASGPVILDYFRTNPAVERKDDASPVTRADRESETVLRQTLAAEVPSHGIFGEEYGSERLDAEYVWVLDPIDGTRSFINGIPLFGTLIALTRNGAPVLGVIDHPALGERWLGVAGAPTVHWGRGDDGAPVQVRACDGLDQALLCTTSPEMFSSDQVGRYRQVQAAVRYPRFGTDCYAYSMLASGQTDLIVEAGMQPYDYLALAAVVAGAGGIITDWHGAPLTLDSPGTVVAAGDARVHAAALEILSAG
ncbi:MAG: histidinol-phosphatase [Alphaproteobacteria bacterium]|nr:histidinol-phosphatase [Alphaproteobacteria bacterium]